MVNNTYFGQKSYTLGNYVWVFIVQIVLIKPYHYDASNWLPNFSFLKLLSQYNNNSAVYGINFGLDFIVRITEAGI
jgi:hypothetical protein